MYKFQNVNGKCEIFLYSLISHDLDYGMSTRDVIDQIKAAGNNVSVIELHINSEGGDVFESLAMYNYLKSHKARVKVFIDGLAASGASIVACAGKIFMPKNAMLMIHNPMGSVFGESEDMRDEAEVLDKIRDNMANIYASKTGLELGNCIELMNNETWITADEALALGFCDEIIEARNEVKNKMDEKEFNEKVQAAVLSERERLKAIDELNAPGCEKEIYAAKYENVKDAKELAYELLTSGKFRDKLQDRQADALELQDINANVPMSEDNSQVINAMASRLNARRGA